MLAMVPQSLYAGKKMERLSERVIQAPSHQTGPLPPAHLGAARRQAASLTERSRTGNAFAPAGILWILLTGAAALPAGGSVDPGAVVLRAGAIEMTMEAFSEDFHQAARADTSTLGPDQASIDRFLASYLDNLVIQAHAMQDTSLLRDVDRRGLEMASEGRMLDALRERLTSQYLRADEDVLRAAYERLAHELDISAIKVPTLVEVDSVQAALDQGIPFEEVARRYSKEQRSASAGGRIGWVNALQFTPDQQEILWSVPVGGISPLVPERAFHAIYKVAGRRPGAARGTFEAERDRILRAVSASQLPDAARRMHDDLMAAYGYQVDMEAAEWLRAFLQESTRDVRRTYDPNLDKPGVELGKPSLPRVWDEAPLQGEDARRPVAFLRGDTLRALGVIDQLVFMPSLVWPRFENVGDVLDLCDEAMYERAQVREAERLRLLDDPSIRQRVLRHSRWVYWRAYRREKILPEIRPTDAEIQRLYDERAESFRIPERRKFVALAFPGVETARDAAARLAQGQAPSRIAEALQTPGMTVAATPDTGLGWVRYGENPRFDAKIFSMDEGEVTEPLLDGSLYSVLRLDGILPARTRTLDEARPELEQEILGPREKAAIRRHAERLRGSVPVWIDRKAIGEIDFDPAVFAARSAIAPPR